MSFNIKRKMDWDGLIVQSYGRMKNGWADLPAGTLFRVESSHNGLTIVSRPCECCDIKVSISKVHRMDVTILEIPYNYERLEWNKKRRVVKNSWGREIQVPNIAEPTIKWAEVK